MKALDTNVVVRFLVRDDEAQARRVKALFQRAEDASERYFLTTASVLELIWVLTAVYDFARAEVIEALELLSQMSILEFEDFDVVSQLVRLGRDTNVDLPDLVIGLTGRAGGCETTLTFEKGLEQTALFVRI
ncbi:MAG TPA: type II toxin-antitoxin system VapC family toxin [Vicinamibacteria bacterium]|nr:type II toxin-antitoxin system VapC family toxin [Vicinamibacteria bacterium]